MASMMAFEQQRFGNLPERKWKWRRVRMYLIGTWGKFIGTEAYTTAYAPVQSNGIRNISRWHLWIFVILAASILAQAQARVDESSKLSHRYPEEFRENSGSYKCFIFWCKSVRFKTFLAGIDKLISFQQLRYSHKRQEESVRRTMYLMGTL